MKPQTVTEKKGPHLQPLSESFPMELIPFLSDLEAFRGAMDGPMITPEPFMNLIPFELRKLVNRK